VHRAAEFYRGRWRDHAPDLVVQWRNGEYMPNETEARGSEVFAERWRESMSWPTTGSHRPNAAFVAAGPSVAAGASVSGGKIADLVPTWLHCLGLTLPPELEGRVLHEIMTLERVE
jgi:predicted AlkP superfamily phosphohydrolase/phosphomutase